MEINMTAPWATKARKRATIMDNTTDRSIKIVDRDKFMWI